MTHEGLVRPTTITIISVRPAETPPYAAYNTIVALQEALTKRFGNCRLEGNSSDRATLKVEATDQLFAVQVLPEILGSVPGDHSNLHITYSSGDGRA